MRHQPCLLLLLVGSLAACWRNEPPPAMPPSITVAEPGPDAVESVIFLVGDAGLATMETTPLIHRLRDEVEQWSRGIARDGGVIVLYLGDNAYPVGLRDPTSPGWVMDSTHLQAQLDVVAGENARRFKSQGVFIAGNHDWGHMPGEGGRDRLDNQGRFIARRSRAGGFEADLLPRASDPSPGIIDVGRHIRLLLIDSAWWLLEANPNEKARVIQMVDQYMSSAQGRQIVLAAHHPWASASAHGGLVPFWKTIGVKWLLSKSGAALQDINSLPYRDLKNQLTTVFQKNGPPFFWAGGHDHALQVIRGIQTFEPRMAVVSGAASKSSHVGTTDGMLYRSSGPGFMRLVVMKTGAIDLFVVDAPAEYLTCAGVDPARQQCLETGAKAFRTVFSIRLKE